MDGCVKWERLRMRAAAAPPAPSLSFRAARLQGVAAAALGIDGGVHGIVLVVDGRRSRTAALAEAKLVARALTAIGLIGMVRGDTVAPPLLLSQ